MFGETDGMLKICDELIIFLNERNENNDGSVKCISMWNQKLHLGCFLLVFTMCIRSPRSPHRSLVECLCDPGAGTCSLLAVTCSLLASTFFILRHHRQKLPRIGRTSAEFHTQQSRSRHPRQAEPLCGSVQGFG